LEIIDAFCGIGPWAGRDRLLPYRPEDILSLMDHFGISKALVYHNSLSSGQGWVPDANRMVAEEAARNPRFIPAFAMSHHPYEGSPTLEGTLEAMRRAGAKVAWLWVPGGRLFSSVQSWMVGEWLSACSQRRLPVLCHIEGLHVNDINMICSEFPELRLIVTGVGYTSDSAFYPLLRRHANLHLCLGHFYIPSGNPDRFLRHFPAERLVFGSGLPHFSPGELIGHVMYANIDEESKEKILSGNLNRMMQEVRL